MEHIPILERQVQDMQQFMLFWPYYKARLQHREGRQPDFKTNFSPIGPEKPSTDEKEFYQFDSLYTLVLRKHQTKIIFQERHWETN